MKEYLLRAYATIGDYTPMISDCGALCEAACCDTDEEGQGGVFLFPGEREMLCECEWGRIQPHVFAPMLVCDEYCDRDRRPLACRIFPLTPVRGENGRWTVRMDVRARPVCPLVRSGIKGLNPDFVRAVRKALRIIGETDQGNLFLEKWMALEEEYRKPLW